MDSTTLAPPAEQTLRRPSIEVPRDHVWPSELNPRTAFDGLDSLAASMAPPVGIIEPLVVRPYPKKGPGHYEIIAGERRWRASAIAKLETVPVIVRDLTDVQVLDVQLIENDQRQDIHPLDHARALQKRLTMTVGLTPKSLAKTLGLAERTMQNKLRYLTLIAEAQRMFMADEFTSGHADLLIRLSTDDQKLALKDGLHTEYWDNGDDSTRLHEGGKPLKRLRSVREFDEWVKEHVRLKLDEAAQSGMFPELAAALAPVKIPETGMSGRPVLLEVVDTYHYKPTKGEKPPFPLSSNDWKEVKKGDKCEHAQRAVVVMGGTQGRILNICTATGKCKTHWPYTIKETTARASGSSNSASATYNKQMAAARKRDAAERVQRQLWNDTIRPVVMKAVRAAAEKLKPGPKVYQFIGDQHHGRGKYTTLADLVVAAADNSAYSPDALARDFGKPLGIDVKKIVAAATPKPEKPAAKKPAKKTPAKKSKGGRKKK